MSTVLPPISVVTPSDHGAFILITSGFGLSLILIFTIIRVFARLFINPPFDGDDLLMGISTVSFLDGVRNNSLTDNAAAGYHLLGHLVLLGLDGIW